MSPPAATMTPTAATMAPALATLVPAAAVMTPTAATLTPHCDHTDPRYICGPNDLHRGQNDPHCWNIAPPPHCGHGHTAAIVTNCCNNNPRDHCVLDGAAQCGAAQCWMVPRSARRWSTVLDGAAQCWVVQHSAGRCSTVLDGAAQCWTVQHSAGRCSTVLDSAAQC